MVVFGASGFIGSAVTEALVAQGHDVPGIVRSKAGATLVYRVGATRIIGETTRSKIWAGAVCQRIVSDKARKDLGWQPTRSFLENQK
jgi:nucleoside-diphosphate-sugar epimerase